MATYTRATKTTKTPATTTKTKKATPVKSTTTTQKKTTTTKAKKETVEVPVEVPALPVVEQATTRVENSTAKVKETEFYPKNITVELAYPNSDKNSFYWEEYSPRCAAITAENFETVHYLAFPDEESGITFMNAIHEKHCKDAIMRPSKRFDSTAYPFEVKVWGMSQKCFLGLVKRDLDRLEKTN